MFDLEGEKIQRKKEGKYILSKVLVLAGKLCVSVFYTIESLFVQTLSN